MQDFSIYALAREYVARQEGKVPPVLEVAECCNTISDRALHLHQRGFIHMTIYFQLKRVAFRDAVDKALLHRSTMRHLATQRTAIGDEKINPEASTRALASN